MADLSRCMKIVGAFEPDEIAELERHAADVAGGAQPQAHHYMVAAERILADLKGSPDAAAPRVVPPDAAVADGGSASAPHGPTEAADISDIEDALKRYNSEPDQKRALEHLDWVADEADHNQSPRVREYARQRLQEEAAPDDLRKLIEARASTDGDDRPTTLAGVSKVADHTSLPPGSKVLERMTGNKVDVKPEAVHVDRSFRVGDAEYNSRPLSEGEQGAVRAALWNLYQGPARNLMVAAMRGIKGFVGGSLTKAAQGGKADALYMGGRGAIWLSADHSLGRTQLAPGAQTSVGLAHTVAHELIHAVDDRGDGTYASQAKNSPTLVTMDQGADGKLKFTFGPMMRELLTAYWRNPDALGKLDYALEEIASAMELAHGKEPFEIGPKEYDTIERAIDHAAVETPAVLMENYLTDPDALRRFSPQAYSYVESLAKASDVGAAHEILAGGKDESTAPGTAPGQRGEPGGSIRTALQGDSGAGSNAEPLRVHATPEAVVGRGSDRPGSEAGAGGRGGSDRGLSRPGEIDENTSLPQLEKVSPLARGWREIIGGWQNFPGSLGWLTNRQIADIFRDIPAVRRLSDHINAMANRAKGLMQESHVIDQAWAKLKPAEAMKMAQLMLRSTMEKMHVDRGLEDPANAHLGITDQNVVKTHERLSRDYQELSPQAKKVFADVERKFTDDWKRRADLLRSHIVDQYRPELAAVLAGDKLDAAAKLRGDARDKFIVENKLSRQSRKSLRALWSDLDSHDQVAGKVQGPYFPLMRFGQHVVVAKSPRYLAAEARLRDAMEALQKLNNDDSATAEQLKQANADVLTARQGLQTLKDVRSGGEYTVEFYEHRTQAEERRVQLANHFKDTPGFEVYRELREQHFARLDGIAPSYLRKIEEGLSAGLPTKDANEVRSALRDIYIQSMPERSALKAQLERANIAGAKVGEMRRAFASSTLRNAWHMSRLEFGSQLHDALNELRGGRSDKEKLVGAEMAKRLVNSMQFNEASQLITHMAGWSYFSYLGMSPSFFIMNATQPWLISAPIMAARHGVGASLGELGKAFRETAAVMRSSLADQKTWRFELDTAKLGTPAEQRMLHVLTEAGLIDTTIEHDLGAVASGREQTALGQALRMASLPAHHTEVLNRVMTALAAYRMEMRDATKRGLTGDAAERAAIEYAQRVVADTHLDYTPENAPRLMRSQALGGLGRLVFQFKKYTQGMLYLLGKNMFDAAKGSPEARKAVAYLLGTTLAVSGTSGLPGAQQAGDLLSDIINLFVPADERRDLLAVAHNAVRGAVGDRLARLLIKGAPAGLLDVDVSQRLGMSDVLDPFHLMQGSSKTGRDWVADKIMQMAGPAASLAANYAEALSIAASSPMKAAELAMPKVLADALRVVDRANNGITDQRGNVLMSPEDIGPASDALKLVGLESARVTDMYDQRKAFNDATQNLKDARNQLLNEFARARMNGGDVSSVRKDIADFNQRNPHDKISVGNMESAVTKARQAARDMRNGIRLGKRDADVAERLGVSE
jgi:hypothetical protein